MSDHLAAIIKSTIKTGGPMSIAQYMHLCNAHPQYGYYATGNPVGKDGDFITAPEISQMFGELIGIWLHEAWNALGRPSPIQVVELGPGRGTMMKDIIRTTNSIPAFREATDFILIETSPSLIEEQKSNLMDLSKKVSWHSTIEEIPPVPTLFVGNEFLDAIPFRQFVKSGDQWQELAIGLDEKQNLTFVRTATNLEIDTLPKGHEQEPDGAIFEYAPTREAFCEQIARHILDHNGMALLIDYGHAQTGFGDTFQAIRAHQSVSPLSEPGSCDLTSHVDFGAINKALTGYGLTADNVLPQGRFLLELGLLERAGQLGYGKSPEIQNQITADVERLAADDQMGSLFKLICIRKPETKAPLFD